MLAVQTLQFDLVCYSIYYYSSKYLSEWFIFLSHTRLLKTVVSPYFLLSELLSEFKLCLQFVSENTHKTN